MQSTIVFAANPKLYKQVPKGSVVPPDNGNFKQPSSGKSFNSSGSQDSKAGGDQGEHCNSPDFDYSGGIPPGDNSGFGPSGGDGNFNVTVLDATALTVAMKFSYANYRLMKGISPTSGETGIPVLQASSTDVGGEAINLDVPSSVSLGTFKTPVKGLFACQSPGLSENCHHSLTGPFPGFVNPENLGFPPLGGGEMGPMI
jgi:hypothetical protein